MQYVSQKDLYHINVSIHELFIFNKRSITMASCHHVTDLDSDAALFKAAKEKHDDCLKTLIQAGANVNVAHKGGNTALHVAAVKGLEEQVKMLLEAGADVNKVNQSNEDSIITQC